MKLAEALTVEQLREKLKDCAPGAKVWISGCDNYTLTKVESDGEKVTLS